MKLMSLTIDEVSMVSLRDINILNNRCAMIKHRDASLQDFGKIAVLAVDDLYQLPPVKAKCIFDCPSDPRLLVMLQLQYGTN